MTILDIKELMKEAGRIYIFDNIYDIHEQHRPLKWLLDNIEEETYSFYEVRLSNNDRRFIIGFVNEQDAIEYSLRF